MTQAILHRTAPRPNLLAAAVLSSLATAEAAPPKEDLAIANFETVLHADAKKDIDNIQMALSDTDSAKTTEHQQIGKKQRGPRYGADQKADVTDALSHKFGGLNVAHHREPLATAGMARRREHLSVH